MNPPDLFNEKAEDWDANDRVKALSSAVGRCHIEAACVFL